MDKKGYRILGRERGDCTNDKSAFSFRSVAIRAQLLQLFYSSSNELKILGYSGWSRLE
jgi:hypothetical protein